jgi:methylthioribose-1-phosphate isomerase
MMMKTPMPFIQASPDNAIVWHEDRFFLLDQRVLPRQTVFVELTSAAETAQAIAEMVVRGAPAIGITAAYGVVLAVRDAYVSGGHEWRSKLQPDLVQLHQSRPTAANLFWALERMQRLIDRLPDHTEAPHTLLLQEAQAIHAEDIAANKAMGEYGVALVQPSSGVITHCNAGALATGGFGTALGVIRAAHSAGKLKAVYVDETRPWLQGARLTAWELLQDDIPVTLLSDSAAASLMAKGEVDWVIVGSDRIAANGDVANKIGTYPLAITAKYHDVKVMVVAPTTTIDMTLASGEEIPIEVRDADELVLWGGRQVAASGVSVWNPVFDVTPARLVDVIVTEKGVISSPDDKKMAKLMGQ